ncbi:MAG: hypothetical protein DMG08_21150 [Acidobacteria bacterium]|nr:MAG: hypothetical protein DMG08_21150 [Acidobacteriota bacterium]
MLKNIRAFLQFPIVSHDHRPHGNFTEHSTVLFGVRQLAAAFVRVELLRLRKGASKLAHSKKDAPRMLQKSLPGCEGLSA